MNVFFVVFGTAIGILFCRLIVTPMERKKYREECKRDGLIPSDWS